MEKIINKDFRRTKEVKLPTSGITVEVYSSILVGDVGDKGATELDTNLAIIAKAIKGWNRYAKQEDDKAMAVSVENIKTLPATDFEFLMKEFTDFANDQKKS